MTDWNRVRLDRTVEVFCFLFFSLHLYTLALNFSSSTESTEDGKCSIEECDKKKEVIEKEVAYEQFAEERMSNGGEKGREETRRWWAVSLKT